MRWVLTDHCNAIIMRPLHLSVYFILLSLENGAVNNTKMRTFNELPERQAVAHSRRGETLACLEGAAEDWDWLFCGANPENNAIKDVIIFQSIILQKANGESVAVDWMAGVKTHSPEA